VTVAVVDAPGSSMALELRTNHEPLPADPSEAPDTVNASMPTLVARTVICFVEPTGGLQCVRVILHGSDARHVFGREDLLGQADRALEPTERLDSAGPVEGGAPVVKQGDVGNESFIILEGRLVVSRDGVKIAELGPGGHFGEMSLVDDARRSATVKAETNAEVLSIGQIELNGLMRVEPVLGVKVLWSFVQVLSSRLRTASAEIIELQMDQAGPPTSLRPPFGM